MKLYIAALILFLPLLLFFESFEPTYELFISWYSQTVYAQEAFPPGFKIPDYPTLIGWKLTQGFHSLPLFVAAFIKATITTAIAVTLIRLRPRMAFLLRLTVLAILIVLLQFEIPFYYHFSKDYRLTILTLSAFLFLCPFLLVATRLLRKTETLKLSI